jgi:hypothetical protein
MRALVLVLLASCSVVGWVEDKGASAGGVAVELVACPTDLIDCGHVFLCEAPANNPLDHVEICINDDGDNDDFAQAERKYGTCAPTPRHQGLCRYHCDGGAGCNAYNGCYCGAP